jgi:hypothetical protein
VTSGIISWYYDIKSLYAYIYESVTSVSFLSFLVSYCRPNRECLKMLQHPILSWELNTVDQVFLSVCACYTIFNIQGTDCLTRKTEVDHKPSRVHPTGDVPIKGSRWWRVKFSFQNSVMQFSWVELSAVQGSQAKWEITVLSSVVLLWNKRVIEGLISRA